MPIRDALLALPVVLGVLTASPVLADQVLVVDGFDRPMAARYDDERDRYMVSNAPVGTAGKGFISTVGPDGKVMARKWIEGGRNGVRLDSPKGLAMGKDQLFVADLGRIRVFDVATGKPLRDIPIPGATNLADLTILPNDTILAVDPGQDLASGAVYKVVGTQVSTLAKGPQLWRPASITQSPDGKILIGPSIGSTIFVLAEDGTITGFGQIPAQRMQPSVVRPTERIGGMVGLGGGILLASTWESGRVGRVVLNRKPPLDWDAERRITAMEQAKTGPAADGLETAAVKAILQQPRGRGLDRKTKPRPSIAWPEAPASDFVWSGMTEPNKMDLDRKRNRLIIPELSAGRLLIVPMNDIPVSDVVAKSQADAIPVAADAASANRSF